MFVAIYKFIIIPGKENEFIEAWEELTRLIYEYEGSLGSRLHKESNLVFIAYAQWPNKSAWENSGDKLPEESKLVRKMMRGSCEKIETIHTMDVVSDLLKEKHLEK